MGRSINRVGMGVISGRYRKASSKMKLWKEYPTVLKVVLSFFVNRKHKNLRRRGTLTRMLSVGNALSRQSGLHHFIENLEDFTLGKQLQF